MTTYEEFKEKILEKAEEEMEGRATIRTVQKNNGVKLDALVIMTMGCNVSPSIYLNSYYKEYMDCTDREGALDEIWKEIKCTYFNHLPNENLNTDFLYDFDRVRGKIHMRIVSMEKNKELLDQMVYIPYLDLAVVFTIVMSMEDCAMATIVVHKEFLECWGVDETELWKVACENMAEDFELISLSKIMGDHLEKCEEPELDPEVFILTNHSKVQGAVTMAQPGVLCRAAEELSAEKLVILPSSVHEVLLVVADDEMDMNYFNNMVREVNSSEVMPEEVLSDHVYVYDRESDEVKIA